MRPDSEPPGDTPSDDHRAERLLDASRGVVLENWSSQRDDLLRRKKEWRAEFEHRLRERWGEALDEYELVVEAAMQMWIDFNRRWFYPARVAGDHQTVSLIELHGRCLRIAQEVLALLFTGYAAGAHARARTMHELAVVAMFLRKSPTSVARRYREHSAVKQYKRAIEYNETLPVSHAERGYEPIDERTIKILREQRDQLKKRYGEEFVKSDYGWAATATKNKRPTFQILEKAVNMGHLRPLYALSSQEVHASSHGNQLSYAERGSGARTLNAGPSNGGLADPAAGAMISLLCDPERLRQQHREDVERKRAELRGDPDREATALAGQLLKLERRRSGYIDLAADGDMSREELRGKLAGLEAQRQELTGALREAQGRQERIEELERQWAIYEQLVEVLDSVTYLSASDADRRRLYQALRLRVDVDRDGAIRLSGIFSPDVYLPGVLKDYPRDLSEPEPKVPEELAARVQLVTLDNTSWRGRSRTSKGYGPPSRAPCPRPART